MSLLPLTFQIRIHEILLTKYTFYSPLDFESTKFIDEIISMGVSSGVTEQCIGVIACIFDQLVSGEELLANNSRDITLNSFSIRTNLGKRKKTM